jgi:uncharacterized protein (DUF362 family)
MAFKSHGLPEICERTGAELVNLSKQPRVPVSMPLKQGPLKLHLPAILVEGTDIVVTLPVPKIHQVTTVSGGIKNQWGCIPDNMRLVHHPVFDELICQLNIAIKTKIAIADGTYFLNRSGPMEGEAVQMDLLMASDDIGALDVSICKIMDISPARVRHLVHWHIFNNAKMDRSIQYNASPESFRRMSFRLERTVRNHVVAWAFDRPWAIRLFWNSWFAERFHQVLYAVTGNTVQEDMLRHANNSANKT